MGSLGPFVEVLSVEDETVAAELTGSAAHLPQDLASRVVVILFDLEPVDLDVGRGRVPAREDLDLLRRPRRQRVWWTMELRVLDARGAASRESDDRQERAHREARRARRRHPHGANRPSRVLKGAAFTPSGMSCMSAELIAAFSSSSTPTSLPGGRRAHSGGMRMATRGTRSVGVAAAVLGRPLRRRGALALRARQGTLPAL